MVRQGLLRFFLSQLASFFILPDQPVHHQVGIAADRRCKMGVALRSQAEVAGVIRRIPGLLHGAQGNGLHDEFGARPLGLLQQLLKIGGLDVVA